MKEFLDGGLLTNVVSFYRKSIFLYISETILPDKIWSLIKSIFLKDLWVCLLFLSIMTHVSSVTAQTFTSFIKWRSIYYENHIMSCSKLKSPWIFYNENKRLPFNEYSFQWRSSSSGLTNLYLVWITKCKGDLTFTTLWPVVGHRVWGSVLVPDVRYLCVSPRVVSVRKGFVNDLEGVTLEVGLTLVVVW